MAKIRTVDASALTRRDRALVVYSAQMYRHKADGRHGTDATKFHLTNEERAEVRQVVRAVRRLPTLPSARQWHRIVRGPR